MFTAQVTSRFMSLTIAQKTNLSGFPKAAELIEITGTHLLSGNDRAIQNRLFQHAHDSGRLADPDADWEIPLADLRRELSKHESNDEVRESLNNLMKIQVIVHFQEEDGEPKTLTTHLLEFIQTHDRNHAAATVKYGFPKTLRTILVRSNRWGRVRCEVTYAMSSKYAMTLYEMICMRINLNSCIEIFPIEKFRDLLGVPPNTYKRGDDFWRFVVEPAMLEINGLSDFRVVIERKRKHPRAPVHEIAISWQKKQDDDFRSAVQERGRSKLGRKARLRGQVETVVGT